jgi:hypothetical protein
VAALHGVLREGFMKIPPREPARGRAFKSNFRAARIGLVRGR